MLEDSVASDSDLTTHNETTNDVFSELHEDSRNINQKYE